MMTQQRWLLIVRFVEDPPPRRVVLAAAGPFNDEREAERIAGLVMQEFRDTAFVIEFDRTPDLQTAAHTVTELDKLTMLDREFTADSPALMALPGSTRLFVSQDEFDANKEKHDASA